MVRPDWQPPREYIPTEFVGGPLDGERKGIPLDPAMGTDPPIRIRYCAMMPDGTPIPGGKVYLYQRRDALGEKYDYLGMEYAPDPYQQ